MYAATNSLEQPLPPFNIQSRTDHLLRERHLPFPRTPRIFFQPFPGSRARAVGASLDDSPVSGLRRCYKKVDL